MRRDPTARTTLVDQRLITITGLGASGFEVHRSYDRA